MLPDPEELEKDKKSAKKNKDEDGDDLMPDEKKKGAKQGNKNKDHVRMNAIKIFLLVVDAAKTNN